MFKKFFKKFWIIFAILIIIVLLAAGRANRIDIGKIWPIGQVGETTESERIKIVSEESVTIEIVKKVTPAVVTIGITKNQPVIDWGFDPWGFGFVPRQQGNKQIKQDIGSGFIVNSSGLIATNKHVVGDASAKYRVITADNKTFEVLKIYRDTDNDLALLKIGASGLPVIELGDSDRIQVGQFALAIGTALGEFRSTVTTGVISGIGRSLTKDLNNIIQTSAAINPGNSGGPLLNSLGQVVGVNVAVISDAQNIGFALPVNLVKEALKNFEGDGGFERKKAFLGVNYRMISRELAILNEVPEGAYVSDVVADSPAESAGVAAGDIIVKIDGTLVRDADGGLAKIISTKKPGQSIELTLYRGSETKTLKATLGEGQ